MSPTWGCPPRLVMFALQPMTLVSHHSSPFLYYSCQTEFTVQSSHFCAFAPDWLSVWNHQAPASALPSILPLWVTENPSCPVRPTSHAASSWVLPTSFFSQRWVKNTEVATLQFGFAFWSYPFTQGMLRLSCLLCLSLLLGRDLLSLSFFVKKVTALFWKFSLYASDAISYLNT